MNNEHKGKLVQINTVCNSSTGHIMEAIQREAIKQGYTTLSFVGRRSPFEDIPCEKFGNPASFWLHVVLNTIFDRQGYGSYFATQKLVSRLREENPDIIHLHNLHGYYIHIPLLFRYLKREFRGKIFWTFHDCWPFTGHCPHFVAAKCDRWKSGCYRCPNKKVYPISFFMDSSKENYQCKKELFCGLNNLTIITPSVWLKKLISESFLWKYPVEVVNNGVDFLTFYPRIKSDQLYEKYHISVHKKILLGVANIWEERKGLSDFKKISHKLSDEYQIVLVGMSKSQIRHLEKEKKIEKKECQIIGVPRTSDVDELAKLYSMAHIFINPSLEESFSLVTVEAMACGTPVIALDTSAVQELVNDKNGIILHEHNTNDYLNAICQLESKELDSITISQSIQKYSTEVFLKRMMELYE